MYTASLWSPLTTSELLGSRNLSSSLVYAFGLGRFFYNVPVSFVLFTLSLASYAPCGPGTKQKPDPTPACAPRSSQSPSRCLPTGLRSRKKGDLQDAEGGAAPAYVSLFGRAAASIPAPHLVNSDVKHHVPNAPL